MCKATAFKIGDTIKIRLFDDILTNAYLSTDGDIDLEGIVFNIDMKKLCGREGKIVKMNRGLYRIKFNDTKRKSTYYFCDEMLEKVQIKSKLKKLIDRIKQSNSFNEELL